MTDVVVIAPAKPLTDRKVFLGLWREFMEERHASGSPILPSNKNMAEFLKLYDSYMVGSIRGGCFIASVDNQPVGIALGGENFPGGLALETTHGNIGILWGVYVRPSMRRKEVAFKLMAAGLELGLELGFEGLVTQAAPDNAGSQGLKDGWLQAFTSGSVEYYFDLRENRYAARVRFK